MEAPTPNTRRPSPEAIELFCKYLRHLEIRPDADFDEFKREHENQATDLALLLDQYERVTAILERLSPSASFSARLREHYGDTIDPEISLDGKAPRERSASTGTSKSSGRVLSRLTAQHPSTSRYETRLELARGGMGAIMEVWDRELRRTLAMKVVLGGQAVQGSSQSTEEKAERRLSRFLEEAQITGQLDHPGIVPVHDIGIDDAGRVYFTMQLVDGHDLRKVFEFARAEADGWSLNRVVSVFVRVCEAMAYAHSKGVVHRDLKPANIMVGAFGEAFVMDWGLAKVLDRVEEVSEPKENTKPRKTETHFRIRTDRSDSDSDEAGALRTLDGDVVGTPAYMAPEQARGKLSEVGQHSDIYSMGAMLYHLIAGQAPYEPLGDKVPAHVVLEAVRKAPPWPLRRMQEDVDGELAAICEKAMSREIPKRYPSMMELGEDLRAWVEGRGVKAYTSGSMYELRKWVGRNTLLAFALSTLPLVIVTSLAIVFVQQRNNVERLTDEKANTLAMSQEAQQKSEEATASAQAARDSEASMRREKIRADEALVTARREEARADGAAATAQSQSDLAMAARQRAEFVAYRSLVTSAAHSLQLNDATAANDNLRACEYVLRGWEWEHVKLGLDFSVGTPFAVGSGVTDVSVNEQGTTLLTFGWAINPKLWDLTSMKARSGTILHMGNLGFGPQDRLDFLRCTISPTKDWFAVTEPSLNAYTMYNSITQEELYKFQGHAEPVTRVRFSHDGSLVASSSEDGRAYLVTSFNG
ncbi:MAG: serine/threonine protein kinase, partial [Candidatus Paceibacteria bacterium]